MRHEIPGPQEPVNLNLVEQFRDIATGLRAKLGKFAVIGALATASLGAFMAEEVARPGLAAADVLGYPDADASDCSASYGKYSWCKGGGPLLYRSPRLYDYRNCTDYVAWKEGTLGVNVPTNLGNGGQWYDNAASSQKATSPKAWDAAVAPGNPGHVAFVESVNTDGTITVSEYNQRGTGVGGHRTGAASALGFTRFVDFGVHPTNNTAPVAGPTFTPDIIQRPSGETDLAAVGPANSLDFYYNAEGSPSWNKLTVPGARAYSTPDMVQRPDGETDIAVRGPNNSLDFYFNAQASPTWGLSHVAVPGWAFSAPAVAQRPSGETDIAVQGPNHSLDFYVNAAGSPYWGRIAVAGANSAYSEPAIIQRPDGETDIAVQGPNNSLDFYYNAAGSPIWGISHVAAPGWAFSAPSVVQRSTGETDIAVQGPNNSLDFYINDRGSGAWGRIRAAGEGSTYNDPNPPAMLQRSSGETDIAVQGPGNQADFYFNAQGSPTWGEVIAAANDNSFRAPIMVERPIEGEIDLGIVGNTNSLDFYFNKLGEPSWSHVQIAGARSAS